MVFALEEIHKEFDSERLEGLVARFGLSFPNYKPCSHLNTISVP